MEPERRTIATMDVWQTGLDTLRATRRQTLIIAVLGLVSPQLILGLSFDAASAQAVASLRQAFETAAGQTVGFESLVAPAVGFLSRFALMMIALAALALASYFALVHVVVAHQRQEPLPSVAQAFSRGARMALVKGLWLVAALFILILLGQVLIIPALLVAVLSLNLPVILVAERTGGWRALGTALTMRYVRGTPHNPWKVLSVLITLAALLYMVVAVSGLLVDAMLRGDELLGVGRALWTLTFPGLPFGPVYLAATLAETTLLTTVIAMMPALTAALYFAIIGSRPLGEA